MTRLIRGCYNLTSADQGGVLAIGNFDGLHLGHRALLTRAKRIADKLNTFAMVMIFEPQPLEYYLQAQLTVARLMSLREKYTAINNSNIDKIIVIRFNQKFAQLQPEDFVKQILVDNLRIKHLLVGEDFRFGHRRAGDIAQLQHLAQCYGFTVEIAPAVVVAGERISSTLLRQALARADERAVLNYLGANYTICGKIVAGRRLARSWGFPTANINIRRLLNPVRGVYAVLVQGLAKKSLPGVANIGTRPTIDGSSTVLEIHLLNFAQDIYGRYVTVEFVHKIRDEMKFNDTPALREQIAKDVMQARQYFMSDALLDLN